MSAGYEELEGVRSDPSMGQSSGPFDAGDEPATDRKQRSTPGAEAVEHSSAASAPVVSRGWSSHDESCGCRRCVGFEVANRDALRHGAYALLLLRPRAEELARGLRSALGEVYEGRLRRRWRGLR